MDKLPNVHPGEILKEEFLLPLKLSGYQLAEDTGITKTIISKIINGKSRITADIALRFSCYFGTTPKFWLGLQDDYDIEKEREAKADIFNKIKTNSVVSFY